MHVIINVQLRLDEPHVVRVQSSGDNKRGVTLIGKCVDARQFLSFGESADNCGGIRSRNSGRGNARLLMLNRMIHWPIFFIVLIHSLERGHIKSDSRESSMKLRFV